MRRAPIPPAHCRPITRCWHQPATKRPKPRRILSIASLRLWRPPRANIPRQSKACCELRSRLLVTIVLAIAIVAWGPGIGATAELPTTEIAAGVFVHSGVQEDASPANDDEIANIGFIVGNTAVAVIDPGGSYREGMELRAAIRARSGLPIRYVIVTHVHPDHIFGAAAFRGDHPDFIGHAKLPGALAQRGAYYLRRLRETLGNEADGS